MKKKVVIATHVFSPGKAQALRDYLKDKAEVLFIGHPLFGNLFTWTVGAIDTLWQICKTGKRYDLYVGSNNLNSFVGILLEKMGRVRKVIFYTPDSPPNRFRNKLLNNFYQWVDSFCVKHSDLVWNNSNRMITEREKRGLSKRYRSKQMEVPMGTDLVEQVPSEEINRYEISFVGHLERGRGLELLIDSFYDITKEVPKAKLLIIGSGPLEEQLKIRAKDMNVEFAGFMGELSLVYKRLTRCAFGVAPYESGSYIQYTDSGKVKLYISAGIPIVITKIPEIAHEIERERGGIMIKYDREELAKAVVKLLTDDNFFKECRRNVRKLARKYSYDRIFARALSALEW